VFCVTIGERIKLRREQIGMTQEELAAALGYKSKSSINKIELGKQELTQRKIMLTAQALGTSISYIMGWDDAQDDLLSVGLDLRDVAHELGLSVEYLHSVLAGENPRSVEKITRVAKILADIVREEKRKTPLSDDDLQFALWHGDSDMTEEDLRAVKEYAEFLRQRKKQQ
jgi:transcriptional regulator with XRE-family HTH domain